MDNNKKNDDYQQYRESPEVFRERIWKWLSDYHRGGELGKSIAKFVRKVDLQPRKRLTKALASRIARGLFVFLIISTVGVILKRDFEQHSNIPEIIFDNLESIALGTAGIIFLLESQDRRKKDHYEAWQVINSAQSQPGNGGRIYALEDLNRDGVDLQNISVIGADLTGIKLRYAKLERADFSDSELDKSSFERANLNYSKFRDANLKNCEFQSSRLQEADFEKANLSFANLQNAYLFGANLKFSDLSFANLQNAWLCFADLQNANLKFADLRGANLQGAKLYDSFLEGTNLQGAILRGAYLEGAIFIGKNKQRIVISGTLRDAGTAIRIENPEFETKWNEAKGINESVRIQLEQGDS